MFPCNTFNCIKQCHSHNYCIMQPFFFFLTRLPEMSQINIVVLKLTASSGSRGSLACSGYQLFCWSFSIQGDWDFCSFVLSKGLIQFLFLELVFLFSIAFYGNNHVTCSHDLSVCLWQRCITEKYEKNCMLLWHAINAQAKGTESI